MDNWKTKEKIVIAQIKIDVAKIETRQQLNPYFSMDSKNSIDSPACLRMALSEDSRGVINELRSGKYQLDISQFEEIWRQYDKEGSGRIKVDDADSCVRKILSAVNIPSFSPYQ